MRLFFQHIMPLSLIAGIYGMNLEHMPELKWLHGDPLAMGLMLLVVIMIGLFIRAGWSAYPRRKEKHRRV